MNKQQENSKSKKTNDGIWFSKKRPNNTTITKIDADKKLHIKNLFFIIVAHPLIFRHFNCFVNNFKNSDVYIFKIFID